jgi:signal transduction histidine kinase
MLCLPVAGRSQATTYTDSIRNYLLTAQPDTGKCYLLLRLAQSPDCPPDTLLAYGQQWYNYTTAHRITAGQPDALYAMGYALVRKGSNEEAINSLYKAAAAWEANGLNSLQLARSYEMIATVYKTLGRFNDALSYYRLAFYWKSQQHNELLLMSTYGGLGNTFRALQQMDSAIFYLKKSLALAEGNELAMAQASNNLGNIYWALKNWQAAVELYNKALRLYEKLQHNGGIAETSYNLGDVAFRQQQYQQAIVYFNKSLQAAPEGQSLDHLEWIYWGLADAYYKTGRFEQAYKNQVKYLEIKDSTLSLNMQQSIADLKEKYESEKKEQALALEQARTSRLSIINSNQVRLIYILVAVTILIAGMGYLLFRNMKRKQLLSAALAASKEREKQQLIQEQALKNNIAMLEGREAERQRISRDLHDRLGSTLTSVRLFMQRTRSQTNTLDGSSEKVEILLNEAIDDVRRISHDLSDSVLQQYGLAEALEDLKDTAEASGTMRVDLHRQETGPLPAGLATEIYYICRELVNNAIKHSQATLLSIQLGKEDQLLYLTVEDNGAGFDPAIVAEGIGLYNIKTRANKIKAQYTIDSSPGRGACFSFIIPL